MDLPEVSSSADGEKKDDHGSSVVLVWTAFLQLIAEMMITGPVERSKVLA